MLPIVLIVLSFLFCKSVSLYNGSNYTWHFMLAELPMGGCVNQSSNGTQTPTQVGRVFLSHIAEWSFKTFCCDVFIVMSQPWCLNSDVLTIMS